MTEYNGNRASIHIRCSAAFKARVEAFAKAHGKSVTDVFMEAVAGELQFFDYEKHTRETAAKDDWNLMVELSQDGKQIP